MNYSLTEFFKISGKYDHNPDFLTQSSKIFEKYKEEFRDSYTNFLEITKIANNNIESWMVFPEFYSEIKDKSDMSVV